MNYSLFTSESVCSGHPDKICDQISDAILDEAIKIEPKSRVAVETLVTANRVVIAGEVTCPRPIDYENTARKVIKELGYTRPDLGFSDLAKTDVYIHQQSPDIALGVDNEGAGDQGMMFGYAVDETKELMPLPIAMAHALCRKIDELRVSSLTYLRPDGKSEVTVSYKNGKPVGIENVVLAVPHDPKIDLGQLKEDLISRAIGPIFEEFGQKIILESKVIVNGTGKWDIGGPASDTGVTGRKIVVDSYGGMARIGGGCFSGKDVTKVDRSAAYGARYIAKNIVAAKLAQRCEVQVAYAIGCKKPIAFAIETFGTENTPIKQIEEMAFKLLDMSMRGIIEGLNLRQPIYKKTASYGHFGNNEYPWEQIK